VLFCFVALRGTRPSVNGNALLASMVLLDNVQGMVYNGNVAKIQLKRGDGKAWTV
jgi:hypothetical protein